jgi:serine protease
MLFPCSFVINRPFEKRGGFMKKSLAILVAGLFALSICAPAFGGEARSVAAPMVPGEVLVKYRKGASSAGLGSLMRSVHASVEKRLLLSDVELLKLKGISVEDAVAGLRSSPLVEDASPNYIRSVNFVPNDPQFDKQWNFDDPAQGGDIHMAQAWDIERGGNPGVVVAILDTGVAYETAGVFHQCPDLDTTHFVQGYDFVNNDASPDDDNGHGTHVCGTIAQSTNNSKYVAGIAFNCSVMPVKVMDNFGRGSDENIINGIKFAADHGANVINMSFGGYGANPFLQEAVTYAASKGVVMCASTGNDSKDAIFYPAACPECMAVGATNRRRERASYSNYGDQIDVVAPGGQPPSDWIYQMTYEVLGDPTSGFDVIGLPGTSMACPHVAGLAALLKSHYPTWNRADIRTDIERTCRDLGPSGWDRETGYGLIDAAAALGAPQPKQATEWYLPEGSTNGGFETWVLIQNPGSAGTTAQVTYMTPVGEVPGPSVALAPESRVSINVADTVPNEWSVSTKVTANDSIIVERATYWNNRKGGSESIGVMRPSPDWYLAEGSTNGGFETWVLIQNPNNVNATAQLTFLTPAGEAPGPSVMLGPKSRRSVNVADYVPGEWSVSTKITADNAVVAERSMYWNNRQGGHDSIGVTAPSMTWYLPEGATNGGFETWVLVMNPGNSMVDAQVTYLTPQGEMPGPTLQLAPGTRQSINVADTLPNEWSVSTTVVSDGPVIAERATYWNNRIEGSESVGATAPARSWYLAEGSTNGGFETWVLIQNPLAADTSVQVTYMTPDGERAGPSFSMGPKTRVSVNVADSVPNVWSVSTRVTATEPVVVERSMYWNNRAGGHASIGVPLEL